MNRNRFLQSQVPQAFLLLVIGVLGATTIYFAAERGLNAGLLNVLSNIAFSGFLVYLYIRMADSQEKQERIMENQEKLMEINHQPILEIGPIDFDGELHFSILNSGNGPAKDITLLTEWEVDDASQFSTKQARRDITKQLPQGDDPRIPHLSMENAIRPEEGKMSFVGFPKFKMQADGEERESSLNEILSILLEENDSVNLNYEIYVEWKDLMGNSDRTLVLTGVEKDIRNPLPFGATDQIHIRTQ